MEATKRERNHIPDLESRNLSKNVGTVVGTDRTYLALLAKRPLSQFTDTLNADPGRMPIRK